MPVPYIGIVTVTYNSSEDLPDFLASLERQSFSDYILYAIDNNSSDESVAIMRGDVYARVPIKVEENDSNRGVAAGNNQGICAALADGCSYVLLLNNDTTFEPDFLLRLTRAAGGVDGPITPRILAARTPGTIWYDGGIMRPWQAYKAVHQRLDFEAARLPVSGVRRVEYAPTCALLVPKSVFDEVGLMDERFFVYCDDVDFMLRLKQARIPVTLDPSITMVHRVGGSTGGVQSDFGIWWETRNSVVLTRKHATSTTQVWVGVTYLAIRAVVRCLRRRDSVRQGLLRLRAVSAGLELRRGTKDRCGISNRA